MSAVDIMTGPPRRSAAKRLVKLANKPDDIAGVLAELGLGAPVRLRGQGRPLRASSSSTSRR